ncbi:MAG: hypothetical protein WC240_02080 [Bacilli bacterium]|jgi:hypothetical protein
MEWIITGGILFLGMIVFFVATILNNKKNNEIIVGHLQEVAHKHNMNFSSVYKEEHDYLIENDKIVIYVKKIIIPSNSSVTINARNTWCLRWGGKRLGRSYPNMRYMNELIPYLMCDYHSEKRVVKLVLIYPDTEAIFKYLNESELAIVNPVDNSYGMKVLRFLDFEENFKEIIK